jgi:hypothetical protein
MKVLIILALLALTTSKVSINHLLYSFKLDLDKTYFYEDENMINFRNLNECYTYETELWCYAETFELTKKEEIPLKSTKIHVNRS